MNDPSRGTVWEECCILTPPSIRLIALSATMSNADEIVSWLGAIHGQTALVASEYRPVPLRYYFADNLGVLPLFSQNTAGPGGRPDAPITVKRRAKLWKLNPQLRPEGRMQREADAARARGERGARPGGGRGDYGGGRDAWALESREERGRGRGGRGRGGYGGGGYGGGGYSGGGGYGGGGYGRGSERQRSRAEVASMPFLVRQLARKEMLPAIIFIFSRNGCTQAVEAAAGEAAALLTKAEASELRRRVEQFRSSHADLPLDDASLDSLASGVAAHHAGMLPLEKGLVEQLFQANLLKVRR